jgi:serine/threonine protein kinase
VKPERIDGSGYGFAESVWSTGLVLLELAVGCLPFPNHVYDELGSGLGGVITSQLLDRAFDQAGSTAQFREFIRRCLNPNPNHRPSAHLILKDAFIRRHINPDSVCLFGESASALVVGQDTKQRNRVAPESSEAVGANQAASPSSLCTATVVVATLVITGGVAFLFYKMMITES